jgi:aryl-alcohol dehydrogenase-like predicted oxidoreductase
MQKRILGRTSLPVSPIGLGLAALGRPGYINLGHATDLPKGHDVQAMEAHAHALLDAAWKAGIRYFDAARSYGRAESFLAGWLASRKVAPGEATVGSKWGYTYTANWQTVADKHEVKQHTLETLRRQAAESRSLLAPYLNLYQIHSATRESGVLENEAVLEELARLRDQGWKIGLTVTGPGQAEQIRRALDIAVANEPFFDCVQATWNILEPSAGPALQEAKAAGLGVIVKEALANGRLTERNDDPAFASRRSILKQTAQRLGVGIDAIALAAALACPWADVVLSGAATLDQLASNLSALTVVWDSKAGEAVSHLAEKPDDYWNMRAGLAWN